MARKFVSQTAAICSSHPKPARAQIMEKIVEQINVNIFPTGPSSDIVTLGKFWNYMNDWGSLTSRSESDKYIWIIRKN